MFSYRNPAADKLIETIRTTVSDTERNKAYMSFQEILHEDQPIIFLYSPVERFVTSKRVDPVISINKPGYFINAFSKTNVNIPSAN